jgi:S1-C subfamily serine protease
VRSTIFKPSIYCILALAVALSCIAATQLQAQAKGEKKQELVSIPSSVMLDRLFHEAREDFQKKDTKEAAFTIHQGATLLKEEAREETNQRRSALALSARELDRLADRVQEGTIHSAKDLDWAFARVHHVLARYYRQKASESWANKAISQASRELEAAAFHLESAIVWAGEQLKDSGAIEEAKDVARKLGEGTTWVASEVSKGIQALEKEIDGVGHQIGFPGLSYPSSVTVSEQTEGPVNLRTAVVRVAKENIPAVVAIEVIERREVPNFLFRFRKDPFFRRFFGLTPIPRKFKEESVGLGSGMIVNPRGDVLTNDHVVAGATQIEVMLSDGDRYPAKLVGGDSETDLAVIRILGDKSFSHVIFGDSDKVEVGQWVVAIGAPRSLLTSVTQGIISGKHRRIEDGSGYRDFLQTDAPINPGNSGGPLLNLYGEVIGVNAAIATESGGFEGIGFTIPSKTALAVMSRWID